MIVLGPGDKPPVCKEINVNVDRLTCEVFFFKVVPYKRIAIIFKTYRLIGTIFSALTCSVVGPTPSPLFASTIRISLIRLDIVCRT